VSGVAPETASASGAGGAMKSSSRKRGRGAACTPAASGAARTAVEPPSSPTSDSAHPTASGSHEDEEDVPLRKRKCRALERR
jgi:hypothetical protein